MHSAFRVIIKFISCSGTSYETKSQKKFRNSEALILLININIMNTRQCILSSTLKFDFSQHRTCYGRYTRCLDSRLAKIIYTDQKHQLISFTLLQHCSQHRLVKDYFLFMTSSLVAALTSVRFVSQQFRALDNWYLNRRYILLITIGDKEDSKQSQQMPAENFNLQWNITFSKHLRQFAPRIESPSLSVSYESCQYNTMLTIFAKVWLQMHARRLLSHKNLFY